MILRQELVLKVLVLFVSSPIFLSSRQCFPKGRSLLCPRTLVEAVHTLKERLWRIETQFPPIDSSSCLSVAGQTEKEEGMTSQRLVVGEDGRIDRLQVVVAV
ncbi:hypothetical protein MKW92_048334 [Papaver armeniacum]|nr:hypothetical protein MKW92_048334 [Papaver armeniacum]